jgi:predicted nucleic acid-binding protein
VRFWDTSAVLPLLVQEASTDDLLSILSDDRRMIVWWATPVECISAVRRRIREGVIDSAGEAKARDLLAVLAAGWTEIEPTSVVRSDAERLLGAYTLRAADALQLAAARAWRDAATGEATLVATDHRLRDAAGRGGFTLLPR